MHRIIDEPEAKKVIIVESRPDSIEFFLRHPNRLNDSEGIVVHGGHLRVRKVASMQNLSAKIDVLKINQITTFLRGQS